MGKRTQRYKSAYSAGVQANKDGLSKKVNPYPNNGSGLHAAWFNGWVNGQTKKEIKGNFTSMLLHKIKDFMKGGNK